MENNNKGLNISTYSIVELKALLFDMELELKAIQRNMNIVATELENKFNMQKQAQIIAQVEGENAETVDKAE